MLDKRHNTAAAAFLAPNFIGFLIFTSIPVVAVCILTLFRWDLVNPPAFVGLRNFIDLLGWHVDGDGVRRLNDPDFWKYLWNTGFLMLAIPINICGSMFLAIVLNQKLRGRLIYRTIFFLPSICSGVGIMLLWKWIYNPEYGLINYLLSLVDIQGPNWLESYHLAKPSLMIMVVWGTIGGTSMILYLAGLQSIDPELYQAAEIDGASTWQKFTRITYPLLMPTTFFILITSVIAGFQGGFDMAYVMTRGGPAGTTTTLVYYIWEQGFFFYHMGYAATIAIVLFALVLVVTVLNWKFGGRKVHYV